MKIPEPIDPDTRLRQIAKHYVELLQVGGLIFGASLAAFAVGCTGYFLIKLIWRFLLALLRAVGEV